MLVNVFWLFFVAILGFLFGWTGHAILSSVIFHSDGVLLVDDRDENVTHWTLRYDQDPKDIADKKVVRFDVHVQK